MSAVRVRWEREKRKSAEEPTAKKGRRKAVKAEPAPPPVEARPTKRRRTAAEVAVAEAQAQSEREAELAALELERPIVCRDRGASAGSEPRGARPRPVQGSARRARGAVRRLERPDDHRGTGRRAAGGRRLRGAAPSLRADPRAVHSSTDPASVHGPARTQAGLQQQRPRCAEPARRSEPARRVRAVPARAPRRPAPSDPTPRRAADGRRGRRANARWWIRMRCRRTSCARSRG